jgi:hypothetical protein
VLSLFGLIARPAEKRLGELLRALGESKAKNGVVEKMEGLRAVKGLLRRTKYPLSELGRELNRGVKQARFVLWVERESVFAPGLYCDNMTTALATALFSQVASPQSVAICERCGNHFTRTKRAQRFCSLRCGNADRKARQRERR